MPTFILRNRSALLRIAGLVLVVFGLLAARQSYARNREFVGLIQDHQKSFRWQPCASVGAEVNELWSEYLAAGIATERGGSALQWSTVQSVLHLRSGGLISGDVNPAALGSHFANLALECAELPLEERYQFAEIAYGFATEGEMSPGALRQISRFYVREMAWQKAIPVFDALVLSGFADDSAYIDFGIAYRQLGEHTKAIRVMESGLTPQVDRPDWRVHLLTLIGNSYLTLGNVEQALNRLEEAVSLLSNLNEKPPIATSLFFYQGIGYERVGDRERARSAFLSAIELTPSHSASLLRLARYSLDDGNPIEAEGFLQGMTASDQRSVDAGCLYYQAYTAQGDNTRAAQVRAALGNDWNRCSR